MTTDFRARGAGAANFANKLHPGRAKGAVQRVRFIFVALPVAALGLASCQGCRSSSATPAASAAHSAHSDELGPPPTVRLYFPTDIAGALEPCGCTKDQLGGLDHFGAWVRQNKERAPRAFVASAGPLFFMDESLMADHADQDRARATTIARVLHGLDFVAFAPGSNDWAGGGALLVQLADQSGAAIFANASASAEVVPPFATIVVRSVTDTTGHTVKVAFVGRGQAEGPANAPGASPTVEQIIRRDFDRAKADGANVVIALAALGRGAAKRIADAVPDLAAVVVGSPKSDGDANTTAPPGERVGDVLVVQAANHLQSVGVLDLYVRGPVVPGQIIKFADATGIERARRRDDLSQRINDLHVRVAAWEQDRGIAPSDLNARRRDLAMLESERDTLDATPAPASGSYFRYTVKEVRDSMGKDASIDAEFLSYYKLVDEHNKLAFANRRPLAPAPDQSSYLGVEACSTCHQGPRQVWSGTAHSHAYLTLSSQFKEYNLDCVGCHVTGYEKPGGSTVTHVDKLKDVQCEVCHGPGSRHAKNPTDTSLIVRTPSPSACLECHHPPHVEQFDAVAKLKEVLGPGHGLPSGAR